MWIAPGASLKIYVNGKFAVSGSGIANGTVNGQPERCSDYRQHSCAYSGSSAFVAQSTVPRPLCRKWQRWPLRNVTGNTIVVSGGAAVHTTRA